MRNALKILYIAVLMLFSVSSFSQEDKVEVLRKNFILKKLELSNNDAEKFWPVYNEYNDKVRALRKNLRQSIKKSADNLSDKEAEDLYQLDLRSRQTELELHKQYSEKIKALIGAKKLITLRKAEEEFKELLIQTSKGN